MEAIASTDRRHLQVQRCMFRMTAFIQHVQRGLVALQDCDQRRAGRMIFAKVGTESTLSSMYSFHRNLLPSLDKSCRYETSLPRRRKFTSTLLASFGRVNSDQLCRRISFTTGTTCPQSTYLPSSRQSGADNMHATDSVYTANMSDHQRSWFYAEYQHARSEGVV